MGFKFFKYLAIIIIACVVVFAIHLFVLNHLDLPLFQNKIILAYVANCMMASAVLTILYLFKEKFKEQLGFIFMAASVLKFVLFFLFFYPYFTQDGEISKLEFTSFFIPYVVSLITEVYGASKLLNSLD